MLIRSNQIPASISVPLLLTFVCVAFILGDLSTSFPWWLMLALGAAPIFLTIAWKNTLVGFYIYFIFLLFSPYLKVSDAATVVLMGIFYLKALMQPGKLSIGGRYRKIFLLLYLFLGWCFASIMLSKLHLSNTIDYIYRDSRVLLYWCWLPLLLSLMSKGDFSRQGAQDILISIGMSVVALALLEYFTGVHILGKGRVSELNSGEDVVRVQIFGFIFVTLTLIYSVAKLASGTANHMLFIPLLMFSVMGLYVNFGRAVWVWSTVGVLLLFIFLPIERAKRLLPKFACILFLGFGTLYLVKPAALERAADRILSVQEEGGKSTSYGWRKLENAEGVNVIKHSPLFGVGLGGEYRPWVPEIREFEDHTRYIHNVYLFFSVKLGLPGALMFILLLINIWTLAFKSIATTKEPNQKYFAITVSAALPAFFMLNITQPELEEPFGVIYLVLILCSLYVPPQTSGNVTAQKGYG